MQGIESFKDRLRRFTFGKPIEVFAGITNNIACTFNGELKIARAKKMTTTICLLTHAIMQVVADKIYSKAKEDRTKFFLETFVDGDTPELKFSSIACELHSWRNVEAHQIFFKDGHTINIDYEMPEGWKREEHGILHLNPGKYADRYLKMLRSRLFFDHWKQEPEKRQTVRKYRFIADYLDLPRKDDVRKEVERLQEDSDDPTFSAQEDKIQSLIKERYSL